MKGREGGVVFVCLSVWCCVGGVFGSWLMDGWWGSFLRVCLGLNGLGVTGDFEGQGVMEGVVWMGRLMAEA